MKILKVSSRRERLYDGAVILHPYLGKLKIIVQIRDNIMPPELWEAYRIDGLLAGKLACPSANSEKKLHKNLKCYSPYRDYSFQ